jgi:hypothetical protein
MATKRSSGLDFSDKLDALAAHPDVLQRAPNATNLQRNKTERHRLQGLMRNVSNNDGNHVRVGPGSNNGAAGAGAATGAGGKLMDKLKDEKLMDRWHTWLINGGRSKILLGVYVFLHLVVITMGFLQYQLKDNNSIARSEVGLGFGESSSRPLRPVVVSHARGGDRFPGGVMRGTIHANIVHSIRSYNSSGPTRRRRLHSLPSLPKLHLPPPPNGTKRYNPL